MLKACLDSFMIVFIDDILIYSDNRDEHEHHLQILLQIWICILMVSVGPNRDLELGVHPKSNSEVLSSSYRILSKI